jgi:hypothetical protein
MGAPRKNPPANAAVEIEQLCAQGFANIGLAMHFKVSKDTLKRWLDDYPDLQEAFERGREVERQQLHAAVYRAAMAGKGANVNAFFLLKARFGYVEADNKSVNVNVGVEVATNILVIKDHGTDEQWQAKVIEQQRRLAAMSNDEPKQLEASHVDSQATAVAPSYGPPTYVVPEAVAMPVPPVQPPSWVRKA